MREKCFHKFLIKISSAQLWIPEEKHWGTAGKEKQQTVITWPISPPVLEVCTNPETSEWLNIYKISVDDFRFFLFLFCVSLFLFVI